MQTGIWPCIRCVYEKVPHEWPTLVIFSTSGVKLTFRSMAEPMEGRLEVANLMLCLYTVFFLVSYKHEGKH